MVVVKTLLLGVIESALNQYLLLDEDAPVLLNPIAGKIIAVTLQPFAWTFFVYPTTHHIQLLENCLDQPDATLTGSALAFGIMGLSSNPQDALFSREITITGDLRTARKFQELFAKLDINLEEHISHYTGDIIAHKLGSFFRSGKNWTIETMETFQLNLAEYLHDETRDLPPQPELDVFFRDVVHLRNDFERLQARVKRLEINLENKDPDPKQVNS